MSGEGSLRDVMMRASALMLAFLLASRLMGYLFHLVFANFFTKDVYGTFVFVWSLGLFLTGLMPNVPSAVSRYVAFYRGRKDRRKVESTIRTGIYLNTAVLGVFLMAYSLIYFSGLLRVGVDFSSYLFLISVVVLTSYVCLFGGIITGYRKPEVTSFMNLIQNVLRLFAVAAAVLLASSLHGVMAFVALAYLIYAVFLASYEFRRYGFGSSCDGVLLRRLFGFGVFNVFYETANNLFSWANIFLLQFFLGSAVVAVYNVSWLASTLSLIFFTAVLQIFTPVVTEMFGSKSYDRISYVTSYLLESFFLLFLPVFAAIMLFSREILTLFFAEGYAHGAGSMQVLSLSAFFFGIGQLFIYLVNAEGRPGVNARNIGLGAVLNVALSLALIPSYGMEGAAVATLLASVLILLLSYNHVRGVVPLAYSPWRVAKVVASTVMSVAAVYAVKTVVKTVVESSIVSLVLSSASLLMVYALLLLALKSLRAEDVMLVSAFLEKVGVPAGLRGGVSKVLECGVQPSTSR